MCIRDRYNTASYFKYEYEEDWIVDPMVKEMIRDVDKSTAVSYTHLDVYKRQGIWRTAELLWSEGSAGRHTLVL